MGEKCACGECKECKRRTYQREYMREWNKINPEYRRDRRIFRKYGITAEKYLELSNKGCAICGTLVSGGVGRFHVDHNHDTGQVRGLLCCSCNLGIGSLNDSVIMLLRAVDYLLEHDEKY